MGFCIKLHNPVEFSSYLPFLLLKMRETHADFSTPECRTHPAWTGTLETGAMQKSLE